jgi:hypothetical protein
MSTERGRARGASQNWNIRGRRATGVGNAKERLQLAEKLGFMTRELMAGSLNIWPMIWRFAT